MSIEARTYTWFPGPTRVHTPNGIVISLAVSAGLTLVTSRHTHMDHAACVTVGRILCLISPVRTLEHNALLIRLLISALCVLCACLYHMIPHLSFFRRSFLIYLLPYLSFPLRIDPLLFQAECRKRQLIFVFIFCCSTFLRDWRMHAFVVLGLFFSIPSQEIFLGKRLRNDLFRVECAVKPQLSQSVSHRA